MKKELKSSSRRKWVVGGIAFFGGLALITTGFATWIIGVQVTKATNGTDVTVDTTSNESVSLTATLGADHNISVSENYTGEGKKITSTGDATDFSVTFSSISVAVSPSFLTKNTIKDITFDFNYSATGIDNDKTSNNKVTVSSGPDVAGRADGSYTYLDIDSASKIDLSTVTWSDIQETNGFKTYTMSDKAVSLLKWGTYFGGKSPCNYYNGLTLDWTIGVTNGITTQMDSLYDAFNGGKIAITATLGYSVKS